MSLREMVDARHETLVLGELDFQPACQAPICQDGRPAATHQVVMLQCPCPPIPSCKGCAKRGKRDLLKDLEPRAARCRGCGTNLFGAMADFYRIEKLP